MKRAASALLIVASVVACASEPPAGEFGKFRYAGKVQGSPPLRVIPPIADASGNVYTIYGAIDFPQVNVFVSRVGGGESAGCALTKGDKYGAHGWVGFSQDRAWYWSGDALVAVSGSIGSCGRVLDHDPGTDVSLAFRAVLPWVRDAPSRTTAVALVQSPVDPKPFTAMVDLNLGILTNVRAFTPGDATNVQVIGVGGDRALNQGALLLEYTSGGATVVEGWMLDADANVTARARLGVDTLPAYGVQGYLQISDAGLVEGVLSSGQLVAFDGSGGRLHDPPEGLKPIGVHKWDGALWLVGTGTDQPLVAALDDRGVPSPGQPWNASLQADANLGGAQEVLDDRALPSRGVTWPDVTTAIGPNTFVSPFGLTTHAPGTTLWVVAGPQYDLGGVKETSIAVVPVGVSYP